MWFNYRKRIKFLHILTFIMALLNLTIQFFWSTDFLNITAERFQAPGFHYGHVAFYNSVIMIVICIVVILSANNYSKYLCIPRYFILLFQFIQVILEFQCHLDSHQNQIQYIKPACFCQKHRSVRRSAIGTGM